MANRFLTLVAGIPRLLKRVIFPNDGLRIEDDDASHLLTLLAAAMSANGSLTLDVANGTRRLVINGNTTLNGNNTGDLTLGVPASAVFSITGQELSVVDAGADKIPFWDESAGNMVYATIGSGLTMTGTTLSATGGNASGNVSDGDTLAIGFEFPPDGLKIGDDSGNHTLTLGVSGNCTGNRTVSYLDPGGDVAIDLSHFANGTFTPTATLGNATNGNISTANTTLNPLMDGSGNKLCFYANPNRRYGFETFIPWKGPNTTDGFKIAVSGPASPNLVWYAFTTPVTTGSLNASVAATAFGTTLTQAGGVNMGSGWPVMELKGFVDIGSTGGNVTVEHASEVGGNTTFYAGAFIVVHELP